MRNKWTSSWDGNWFYYRVPVERTIDGHEKETYLLSSKLTPLNQLVEALCAYGPDDTNAAAFIEATSITGSHNVVEEFLTCGLWPLSEKFGVTP
jgi:hypothetical protein